MKTGLELVTDELKRHVTEEGWTPEHDDTHTEGELAEAAVCYALDGPRIFFFKARSGAQTTTKIQRDALWPWDSRWWKPSCNDVESDVLPQGDNNWIEGRIRDLVKSASLSIAEINRLQRVLKSNNTQKEEKSER